MNAKELMELLDREGLIYRITKIDDLPMIITANYNPDRWNLELNGEHVINITFG